MKNRYEALLVLNTQGKEDAVKDVADRLESEFQKEGAEIEQVQKMDKRIFSRVANRKHSTGFYVNFIFSAPPTAITQLKHRFAVSDDIFRTLFTVAPAPKPAVAVADAAQS